MKTALALDLKRLSSFVQVARSGGFSAAALVLDAPQPALSRQIRLLETQLGIDLFNRTGRGVSLTHAGRLLLDRAERLLREAQDTEDELRAVSAAAAGSAVVGMPPTVGRVLTVPLMRLFADQHPQVKIRVVEGLSGDMADWLRSGRVDVAILFDAPRAATVIAEPVVEERLVVLGIPGSLPGRAVRMSALESLPLVLPSPKHSLRRLVAEACSRQGFRGRVTLEVDSLHAMVEAARQGLGLTVAPRAAVRSELAAGGLQAWEIENPALTRTLHVGTAMQRSQAVASGKLAALVRRQILTMAAGADWRPAPRSGATG